MGIAGDLLYPADCVREWTRSAAAHYVELPSLHGHDAFLLETTRVSEMLRQAIARAEQYTAPQSVEPPHGTTPSSTGDVHSATHAANPQPLRVVLAGCGHVGGSLLSLVSEGRADHAPVHVTRVLVRDIAKARPSLARATDLRIVDTAAPTTASSQLLDGHADVFVELMGGTTTARTLIEAALRRGIHVITANKALLATCGPQLQALADAHRTRLDFEGAVGGAIPLVRCLRSGAAGIGITAVSGILNGTSNYVLSRLSAGASLAVAIQEAQQLGYAEADPTRDLSGEDAEDKLRILAWLAFGIHPQSLTVSRRGIDDETASWAARVAANGDAVKMLARCAYDAHGQLCASIAPTRVSRDDPWALVHNADNRIVIESASAGSLVFHGPGAGGRETAGAVLGELIGHRTLRVHDTQPQQLHVGANVSSRLPRRPNAPRLQQHANRIAR